MLITFEGTLATNAHLLSPLTSHIELSHPSLANSLVLAEHDDKPYQNYEEGWTTSNGRSLRGVVRLNGNNWLKGRWECNFLVTAPQLALFKSLLANQQLDAIPTILADRWDSAVATPENVWIDVDRQYVSIVVSQNWWRLQFALLEV